MSDDTPTPTPAPGERTPPSPAHDDPAPASTSTSGAAVHARESAEADSGRRRHAWRRLWRAARLRPSRSGAVVALLAVLLGIAMSAQIRQTREQGLESLRQEELVAVLDTVTQRSGRLDQEISQLTAERERLAQSADGPGAQEAAQARVDALGILAGTVPATGPGVRIVIADTQGTVGAPTLLDAIQELRDAGAEAMEIGTVRVVASTHVTEDARGAVFADGVPLTSPITLSAIGDPRTLSSAMDIPGGVVATIRGVGASVTVTQVTAVLVDSLHVPAAPRYARPEPSP